WSDGSALTAADFVYSWKRAAAPETAADYSYMLNGIVGYPDNLNVTADGDDKLTVVLTAPCAYMLDLAAFPTFYPVKQSVVEAAEGFKDASGAIIDAGAWATEAGFVSCGAYMLESWTHNESMVYVKNPYWYDADNVKIAKLEFMLSADDTAIFAAYQAGNLDFIDTVPTDEIKNLKSNPEFHIIPNLGTYYVTFNVGSPLFEGKTVEQAAAVRKAISRLINRQYIIDTVGQCEQEIATSFIPAGMADGHGGVFKTSDAEFAYPVGNGYFAEEPSEADAIALLESAGYKFTDGKLDASTPLAFEYITNESTGHIAIAQCIQADLAKVGIVVTIKTVDWDTFLAERKAGNFDVARNGWLADFNDPINMLEMWTTESGNNDAQYGRGGSAAPAWAEFDGLIAQIKASTDFVEREALMHAAEDILMETGALCPIYYYNDLYMQKANMSGFYASLFGTKYFMYCDIAK
ncbi:MAG: peptide ABC transporter substrate-binding protein, partial [Lentisphaerae bacterium]|nr:peptide ABC transporter substrate-binding protein [Lentisphaerota bacterium]